MPQADRSRKSNLIKYGFRLPSAIDHRPLRFEELEVTLGLRPIDEIVADAAAQSEANLESDAHIQIMAKDKDKLKARKKNQLEQLSGKTKKGAKTLFVSATPAAYELELSKNIVQQVIRPTGLIDPFTYVYPKAGDYEVLKQSLDKLLQKKPHLDIYMDGYEVKSKEELEAVF